VLCHQRNGQLGSRPLPSGSVVAIAALSVAAAGAHRWFWGRHRRR
jgi:hypothetical protein